MNDTASLSIIDSLLSQPVHFSEPVSTYAEWKHFWCTQAPQWQAPVDRALAVGLAADRPAWVFAAGYQAAIQALTGPLAKEGLGAVCITEGGGLHPAVIRCRLRPDPQEPRRWRLDGTKSFVTGAAEADTLWVVASTGVTGDGRNSLRLVPVSVSSPGVTIEPLPALAVVPELPHAQVHFHAVPISEADIQPGDGYQGAIKPFRTLEDLHVTAAFLAWLFGVGRRAGWPREMLAVLLAHMVTARSLTFQPSLAVHVHIVLGGLLDQVESLTADSESLWDAADPKVREMWARDHGSLKIAAAARQRRLEKAWQAYQP